MKWLISKGCELEDLTADTVKNILDNPSIGKDVREVLNLRQFSSKSSTAKYQRMADNICLDSRVKNNYNMCGTSTGRFTGHQIQFQNLPRGNIKNIENVVEAIKTLDVETVEYLFNDNIFNILSSSIRGMVTSPKGKDLIVADYNAIEARCNAWFCNHEGMLESFKKGEPIYEIEASKTFNKPVEEIGKESMERFVGKQLVLACGYGMGHVKFRDTCKGYGVELEEETCKMAVKEYRINNYQIANQWKEQEEAVLKAIKTGGKVVAGKVVWFTYKGNLYCKLPSGRFLVYNKPSIKPYDFYGKVTEGIFVWGNKTRNGQKCWQEYNIYGGLILENIIQAVARDLMCEALKRFDGGIYEVVMHSHDEVIAEVREGLGSVKEFTSIMCEKSDWSKEIPISAEGWRGKRYKK